MTNWNTDSLVVTEMTEEEMRLEMNRVNSAIAIHQAHSNREGASREQFRRRELMNEQVRRFYANRKKEASES